MAAVQKGRLIARLYLWGVSKPSPMQETALFGRSDKDRVSVAPWRLVAFVASAPSTTLSVNHPQCLSAGGWDSHCGCLVSGDKLKGFHISKEVE